jgi:hypothetical protein
LNVLIDAGFARRPKLARAGPPGSRWRSRNTIRDTPNRTITAWRARRIRYAVILSFLRAQTLLALTSSSAMQV